MNGGSKINIAELERLLQDPFLQADLDYRLPHGSVPALLRLARAAAELPEMYAGLLFPLALLDALEPFDFGDDGATS